MPRFAPLLVILLVFLAGCRGTPETYQGYAEGDFAYLASSQGGQLLDLKVDRGQKVAPGQVLFILENGLETAMLGQAEAELAGARSNLAHLKEALRTTEIEATAAQLDQARATRDNSARQFARMRKLYRSKAVPKADFDQAQAAAQADEARVRQLENQLATARSSYGREEQIRAAEAQVTAARAARDQARWRLDQKTVNAPRAGLVFDILYRPGEWLSPGQPAIRFLAPEDIQVRFFLPEPSLGRLSLGQPVKFACDGCSGELRGRITFLSPEAEYTPPVIYSNERRAKLVFLALAQPDPASRERLHPGQPVIVTPLPPGSAP